MIAPDFLDPENLGTSVPDLVQGALNFIVCENAQLFFGNGYSKFSREITRRRAQRGKPSYVYNVGWTGKNTQSKVSASVLARLRTDKGRLLEPFLSTMALAPSKGEQQNRAERTIEL